MNAQPSESIKHVSGGSSLDVFDVFPTIQGEGPFTGQPAVFVRLAGCNLQCPLCDTDYTSNRMAMPLDKLLAFIRSARGPYPMSLVVITGGEPMRQEIGPLVGSLLDLGYRVQLETNGTVFRPELAYFHRRKFVVCSPKARVHPGLWPYIDALKYVLHADSMDWGDGLPLRALDHPVAKRVSRPDADWRGNNADIYLSPCDTGDPEDNKRHMAAVVRSCMEFGYTAGLQIHKHLSIP